MSRQRGFDKAFDLTGVRLSTAAPLRRRLQRDEVTYTIHDDLPSASTGDCRRISRSRTRLRSGKVLDIAGAFICHCRIYDRSSFGLRLALEGAPVLPDRYLVLDDETEIFSLARTVWRRHNTIGVRLWPGVKPALSQADIKALLGKYYGVAKR